MEKLIELLNEYDGKNHFWDYDEEYLTSEEFYEENWDLEIISKKFWFIKWLVDNDKIDEEIARVWFESNDRVCYLTSEEVLMQLAIQDNPIEFLVSILK